ncbi:hypothetical protein ACFL27_09750 [candidate division CSSED10-310 bacterium]|uniref:Uncharacterized protein n=1 Tax=candidate division CSSED10-310 bacterium TaxID=2855610 RepID=A0ABV6YW71_UNCC1
MASKKFISLLVSLFFVFSGVIVKRSISDSDPAPLWLKFVKTTHSAGVTTWDFIITPENQSMIEEFGFCVEQHRSNFAQHKSLSQWKEDFSLEFGYEPAIEGISFKQQDIVRWAQNNKPPPLAQRFLDQLLHHGYLLKSGETYRGNPDYKKINVVCWSGKDNDRSIYNHEISHARWQEDPKYKRAGLQWWQELDPQQRQQFVVILKPQGYSPGVEVDTPLDVKNSAAESFIDEVVAHYYTGTLPVPSSHSWFRPITDLNGDGISPAEAVLWNSNTAPEQSIEPTIRP